MSRDVEIRGDTIRLGQLLKLAGLAAGGGDIKALLSEQDVVVNGEPETRRGRQLHPGDTVELDSERIRIVAGERSATPRDPGRRVPADP